MFNQNEEVHLKDYIEIILQRRWIIITFFLVMLTTVTIGTFRQIPIYQATATVLIDKESPNIIAVKDVMTLGSPDYYAYKDYLETQKFVITSRPIIKKVYEDLNLSLQPEYRESNEPLKLLQKKINVENIRNTRLVKINVEDAAPQYASEIANGIADAYISKNLNRQMVVSVEANEWLSQELDRLKNKVKESEEALQQYRVQNNIISLDEKEEVINKALSLLTNEYLMMQTKLVEYKKIYKYKNPKMIRLKKELDELGKSLARERKSALDYERKAIEYGVLEREVRSNKELFESVLKRVKETTLSETIKANNISIQERAKTPLIPIKPRKKLNIILACLVGAVGGIGLAFFFDYLDNSIKTPEDVEKYVQYPFLGYIPAIESEQKDTIVQLEPKSGVAEAYRTLRTSILFSSSDQVVTKSILVTSPGPGEGKTITASNLSITMAVGGSRVLLVDSDMRKPRVNKIFDLKNDIGLSNFLVGQAGLDEIVKETGIQNLSVISCGPRPPNPSELLTSPQMANFIREATEKFDKVIFDSPPLGVVTDANILAKIVSGVILVFQGGKTSRNIIPRIRQLLTNAQARILGVCINNLRQERSGYYNYYYYNYQYYGKEDEKKETPEET